MPTRPQRSKSFLPSLFLSYTSNSQVGKKSDGIMTKTTVLGILASLHVSCSASHADILYVADSYNQTIKRFDLATGADLGVFANTNSGLASPMALALDAAGNLYVANKDKNNILKFSTQGVGSVFATDGVSAPSGLAFDKAGNLYVANDRFAILKFTPGGVGSVFATTTIAGQEHLAFDGEGNLFMLTWNSGIRKFSPTAAASTLSTPWGLQGLAFDGADKVYFGGGNTLYRLSANGSNSTFATSSRGDFAALAFDSGGNLWAAQAYRIARFTPAGVESELCGYPTVVKPTGLAVQISSNSFPAAADVIVYTINKTQHLWQNDAGAPVERPYSSPAGTHYAWHTRAQVFFSSPANIISAYVGAAGTTPSEPLSLSDDGLCLEYLDDQPTQASMDSSVPDGTYTLQMTTTHDGTRTADLTLSGSDYPAAPHILNFTSLQGVNPAAALTLSWDPLAGAAASDFILVGVIGANGRTQFQTPLPNQAGALRGTDVSVVVPAGTLQAGASYIGYVVASKVQNSYTASYPGVIGLSWYGRITEFLVTATGSATSKPTLQTSLANRQLVLSWPASATGVVLQTSSTLLPGAAWQSLTSGIATVGSDFVFTNTPGAGSGFFRLAKP